MEITGNAGGMEEPGTSVSRKWALDQQEIPVVRFIRWKRQRMELAGYGSKTGYPNLKHLS